MSTHCGNLQSDRDLGAFWEKKFCALAAHYGRSFAAHQIGREKSAQALYRSAGKYHSMTLPDITIWTRPGEHHEVKHKDATSSHEDFGLERYRLEALLWFAEETGQSVYYTIHDYGFQDLPTRDGRKWATRNCGSHWLTCSVVELADCVGRRDWGRSYVGGKTKEVERYYWHRSVFQPVVWLWRHEVARDTNARLVSVQGESART